MLTIFLAQSLRHTKSYSKVGRIHKFIEKIIIRETTSIFINY